MKNTKFTGELLENSFNQEREIFKALFLYKHEHIEEFQNLHYGQ